eukprot:jgi/Bigna1/132696/aug1.18_g7404
MRADKPWVVATAAADAGGAGAGSGWRLGDLLNVGGPRDILPRLYTFGLVSWMVILIASTTRVEGLDCFQSAGPILFSQIASVKAASLKDRLGSDTDLKKKKKKKKKKNNNKYNNKRNYDDDDDDDDDDVIEKGWERFGAGEGLGGGLGVAIFVRPKGPKGDLNGWNNHGYWRTHRMEQGVVNKQHSVSSGIEGKIADLRRSAEGAVRALPFGKNSSQFGYMYGLALLAHVGYSLASVQMSVVPLMQAPLGKGRVECNNRQGEFENKDNEVLAAFGHWATEIAFIGSLLALRDAANRGRLDATTFRHLNLGLVFSSVLSALRLSEFGITETARIVQFSVPAATGAIALAAYMKFKAKR